MLYAPLPVARDGRALLPPMAHRLADLAQCEGRTRSGRRCSITGASALRDDAGRLVAAPLLHGGRYCTFHAMVFRARKFDEEERALYCFLDFETTGLD